MTKKKKTTLGIFTEAIGLYFSNFKQFLKYMSFPVFGQVIGMLLIISSILLYSKYLPNLIEKYQIFNNINTMVLCSVIVAIPGMTIFIKAFWEYLVAYGAVNSMLDNMLKSGKVYDFAAHTELIKRRTPSFVILWLILGIFSLIASFPLFWVIAGVAAIYLVLTFQVFTYEPELSPIGCLKRSFNLIKGHFASTFLLMFLSGLLCWIFIPQIFTYIFDTIGFNKFLANAITPALSTLPLNEVNEYLAKFSITGISEEFLASLLISTSIGQIFIQYTLPLRSVLCGLLYKELNNNSSSPYPAEKKKISKKRPSEKLMSESNKKFGTKKLDKNILRRAMEKDDEQ